jgi:hypothetical protein
MKRTILGLLTGSALVIGYGVASAQDAGTKIMDGNNPAPTYSPSSTGQASSTSTKIMDGNNPAPMAAPSASGKNLDKSTKIMDGNNPSPTYAASSTAKPVKTAHKAAGTQHASHHHKAHTPAT